MGVKVVGGAFAASVISRSLVSTWQSTKQIWQPLVGEIVTLEREEDNSNNEFAVSLLKDGTVVGHISREFSQVF